MYCVIAELHFFSEPFFYDLMIPMIVVDPHSRVKLKTISGEDFSEYINANYVTVSFFNILLCISYR